MNPSSTTTTRVTAADEAQSFSAYQEIRAALQPYIDSAKSGDGVLTRTAFYDHAHIVGTVKGELYNMDADTFQQAVTQGGPSPEVQHHIAWIDITGSSAAVKLEFIDWGGMRYTDYLVLFKHEGHWKISGKVYDSHANN